MLGAGSDGGVHTQQCIKVGESGLPKMILNRGGLGSLCWHITHTLDKFPDFVIIWVI